MQGSHLFLHTDFSRFSVGRPERVNLCTAGVTLVTTSENTEALVGRSHNRGWGVVPCELCNLSGTQFNPPSPRTSHCHGKYISVIGNLELMQFALFTSPAAAGGGSRPYWLAERYRGERGGQSGESSSRRPWRESHSLHLNPGKGRIPKSKTLSKWNSIIFRKKSKKFRKKSAQAVVGINPTDPD